MNAKLLALAIALSGLSLAASAGNNLSGVKTVPRALAPTVTAQAPAAPVSRDHFVPAGGEADWTIVQLRGVAIDKGGAVAVRDDFEWVGGESGWALKPHKIEFRAGSIAHARDCPYLASTTAAKPVGPSLPLRESFGG